MTDLQKKYKAQVRRIEAQIKQLERYGYKVNRDKLPKYTEHPKKTSLEALRAVKARNIRGAATRLSIKGKSITANEDWWNIRENKKKSLKAQKEKLGTSSTATLENKYGLHKYNVEDNRNLTPVYLKNLRQLGEGWKTKFVGENEYIYTKAGEVWKKGKNGKYYTLKPAYVKPKKGTEEKTKTKSQRTEEYTNIPVEEVGTGWLGSSEKEPIAQIEQNYAYELPTMHSNAVEAIRNIIDNITKGKTDYYMSAKTINNFHIQATENLNKINNLLKYLSDSLEHSEAEIYNNVIENIDAIDRKINDLIREYSEFQHSAQNFAILYKLITGKALDSQMSLILDNDEIDYYNYIINDDGDF